MSQSVSRAEIEHHAKLCARHGDRSDCWYPAGSAAHTIWMRAYEAESIERDEDEEAAYGAAMEREDDRIFRNQRTPL
ncbi:MAG TPA: hypothetical protein VF797_21655 [Noviherbaspirillum sp.]